MITDDAIRQAHVLIVDDEQANVRLLQRMLADDGYTQVSVTMQPKQVCALHARDDHDLILLDLQMPGTDGFQVMRDLKTQQPKGYLPVIVLTAQPAHKLRALQAGARDFISKPFDLVEVRTRIRNLLEVRLLYRQLDRHAQQLELAVQQRTAELRDSEYRFRRLTELASDWYWEQSANGEFTHVSGPVMEMIGLRMSTFLGAADGETDVDTDAGWNPAERRALRAKIEARQPFLDFPFSRVDGNGQVQQYRVSGEPMLDAHCSFVGYRGIGAQVLSPRTAGHLVS